MSASTKREIAAGSSVRFSGERSFVFRRYALRLHALCGDFRGEFLKHNPQFVKLGPIAAFQLLDNRVETRRLLQ